MAGGASGLPQPPREEGVFGPGARKFIAWLVTIAAVVGLIVLMLNVDFGDVGAELDTADETTEEPEDPEEPPDPLSAAGIDAAITALRDEVGGNPHLVRLRADPDSIELDIRHGERPIGYSWSDGELMELDVVVVAGAGPLSRRDYLASTVDPKSLGRMLLGVERMTGGRELEVVNATLEAEVINPDRLRWLLNAEAPNGSGIAFRAKRDGTDVEQLGSTGPPVTGLPPQAREQFRDAERLSECVEDAAGDTDAILECAQNAGP